VNCRFPEEVEVVRLPVVPLYASVRERVDEVVEYVAMTLNVNGEYAAAPLAKVPFRYVPVVVKVTRDLPSFPFLSLMEALATSSVGVNPEYVNDRKASTEKVDDGMNKGFEVSKVTILSAIVLYAKLFVPPTGYPVDART
jgi:hypothetical protein